MLKDRIKLEKMEYNDIAGIEEIYVEAFPKCERKPFSIILAHNESGAGSVLKIMLDGVLCGFFFTFFYGELAMVDYFAIHKDYRNMGIGEIAISLLREEYSDKKIFLEIEDPGVVRWQRVDLAFIKDADFCRSARM